MKQSIKEKFIEHWAKYFPGAELPITFYYTDKETGVELLKPVKEHRCLIGDLKKVRNGVSLRMNKDSIGCAGGKRYLGFADAIRPNFEYFLSCGIPGKMEGERYKKSPELVREIMARMPKFNAPKKFIVFKRWDLLDDRDNPSVAIFFAPPDVFAGLFTLASFDEVETSGVKAPFSAGCGSIVQYPYLEKDSSHPKCILGLFDPSARPYVSGNILSFAAPMNKFTGMIENMESSFLITDSWRKISRRIKSR